MHDKVKAFLSKHPALVGALFTFVLYAQELSSDIGTGGAAVAGP